MKPLHWYQTVLLGAKWFRRYSRRIFSCRTLWPTLQDTETKTATNKSQKSAKVLQFPKREVSRKADTTFGHKAPKLAMAA